MALSPSWGGYPIVLLTCGIKVGGWFGYSIKYWVRGSQRLSYALSVSQDVLAMCACCRLRLQFSLQGPRFRLNGYSTDLLFNL